MQVTPFSELGIRKFLTLLLLILILGCSNPYKSFQERTPSSTNDLKAINKRDTSIDCRLMLSRSLGEVSDRREAIALNTFLVLEASYPPEIRRQISRAIEFSRMRKDFREVGFYVLALTSGQFQIGNLYTSGKEMSLSGSDGQLSFNELLSKVKREDIVRVEHYHTHPDIGVMSGSLSSADISAALQVQKNIASKGLDLPYAENAIHTTDRYNMKPGNAARVEILPDEVKIARARIASQLRATHTQRTTKPIVPNKTKKPPVITELGYAMIEGANDRRAAIDKAIEWAYDVETRKGYNSVITNRQARLKKLSFIIPILSEDRNPSDAFSSAYAVASALGVRENVPNWIKEIPNLYFSELLQHSERLLKPSAGALVVYADEQEQVRGLAVYRYSTPSGIWRVDRRLDVTGNIAYEQDWDDVPVEFGTRAYLFRLPTLETVRSLFNLRD